MKKVLKFIGWALVGLFLLVLLAVLTLPLWINPVACGIANAVAPDKLGTKFHLGQFNLNQYNGTLTVGDLQVFNPPGCKQELAFTLARMRLDADMSTVFSDTMVIEEIDIREVFISYVNNDKGEKNFDVIMRNLEAPAESSGAKAKASTESAPKASKASGNSRKFIVDRLHVEKVLVQWGPLTVPLPPLTLTGIGRSGKGVEWDAIWEEVYRQLMSNLTAAGVNLSKLGNAAGEWAQQGSLHLNRTLDSTAGAVKSVTDGASGAATSIKDGTADALKTIKGLFE